MKSVVKVGRSLPANGCGPVCKVLAKLTFDSLSHVCCIEETRKRGVKRSILKKRVCIKICTGNIEGGSETNYCIILQCKKDHTPQIPVTTTPYCSLYILFRKVNYS